MPNIFKNLKSMNRFRAGARRLKLGETGAIAPLALVILLIAGLGLGVYLSQQRTNLAPEAYQGGKAEKLKKEKAEKKSGKKKQQEIISDNRFIFDFNNPEDSRGWEPQIDPPYHILDTDSPAIVPTTKGIKSVRVEDGFLKFKVISNNAIILSPQSLNISVSTLQSGGYSQTSGKYFRIRAMSDGKGKIEKNQAKTGGVHVAALYHDDQNPLDQDLDKWFQSMPIPKTNTKPNQSTFLVFNPNEWGDFDDEDTFLGGNAYIKGFSLRFTNLLGNEVWIDYVGFLDSYPDRGKTSAKSAKEEN